jgi:serine/threonine-protein kinase RsbW
MRNGPAKYRLPQLTGLLHMKFPVQVATAIIDSKTGRVGLYQSSQRMSASTAFEVQIPSDTTAGLAVQERIVSTLEEYEYSLKDIFAIRLSLEEGITNAIRHGNKNSADKTVTIRCDVSEQRMRVEVQDQGDGFDPGDIPDPTDPDFLERPCGRGLLLMKSYLDHFEYSDNGRLLILERLRNSPRPVMDDDDD